MKGKPKGKSSVLCPFLIYKTRNLEFFSVFLDQKEELHPGSSGFFPAWFFALVNDVFRVAESQPRGCQQRERL